MAAKWMNQLDIHYPHLAERARYLNKRDKFVMKYDPEVVKRRDAAKASFRSLGKNNQQLRDGRDVKARDEDEIEEMDRQVKRSRRVSPP